MFLKSMTAILLSLFCLTWQVQQGTTWVGDGVATITSKPVITANVSGTYTKFRDPNPAILSTWVPPTPPSEATVTITGTVNGIGRAYPHLTANIDGSSFDRQTEHSFGNRFLLRSETKTVSTDASVTFSGFDGKKEWSGQGSLSAYSQIRDVTITKSGTGGGTGNSPASAFDSADSASGEWTVITRNRPGSSCANNDTYNWCTDRGSCTTRSGSGVPGECGHNFCCCAPYGSPTYNGGSSNGGSNGGGSSGTVSSGGGTGGGTGGTSSDRVRCGNAGTRRTSCNRGGYASSSTAHQSVCELGHTYWTCNVAQNNMHGVRHSNRTCIRCGTTFNSRTNGRCTSRWGTRYRWHWEG